MGSSSSKPKQYPLPIPMQAGYPQQPMWSMNGKDRKGRGRSNSDGYFTTMPIQNGYPYAVDPYRYQGAQGFYPQFGGVVPTAQMPMAQTQPNMQMPFQNIPPAQQGPAYDPVAVPPAPLTMPAPPQQDSVTSPRPSQMPQQPPAQAQKQQRQQQQQQQQRQPQQQSQQRQQQQQQQQPQQPQQQQQPQSQQGPVIPPPQNDYQDGGRPINPGVYGPPGPRPRTPIKNPLPTPPRDLYDISPYRSLIRDLPVSTSILSRQYNTAPPQVDPRRHGGSSGGGLGSFLGGSKSGREKKSRKGLFRSSSTSDADRGIAPPMSALFGGPMRPSVTFPGVPALPSVYPQNGTAPVANNIPASNSAPAASSGAAAPPTTAAAGPAPPPVRFNHTTPLSGFLNFSAHRIIYLNKVYPTALHLLEALKFIGYHPDLAERIRAVNEVKGVYPVSAGLQEFVRRDWGQVFLEMAEEVLYLKFKQHPSLRGLLMDTGTADIIYAEATDPYWGEGPAGQGSNELGKAIVRVRERLRAEGYRAGPQANTAAGQS